MKPKQIEIEYALRSNQTINKYGIKLKITKLPAHTNDSIGIIYKDYIFAGDAYEKKSHMSPWIIFIGHNKTITNKKLKAINSNKELEQT